MIKKNQKIETVVQQWLVLHGICTSYSADKYVLQEMTVVNQERKNKIKNCWNFEVFWTRTATKCSVGPISVGNAHELGPWDGPTTSRKHAYIIFTPLNPTFI